MRRPDDCVCSSQDGTLPPEGHDARCPVRRRFEERRAGFTSRRSNVLTPEQQQRVIDFLRELSTRGGYNYAEDDYEAGFAHGLDEAATDAHTILKELGL